MELNIERFDFHFFFGGQIKPYLVFNLGSQYKDVTKCLTLEECNSLWMRASIYGKTTYHNSLSVCELSISVKKICKGIWII